MTTEYLASAYGLVFHKQKVLLITDVDQRGWKPPGGKVKPEESPEEAAYREVWEETGYRTEIQSLIWSGRTVADGRWRYVYLAYKVDGEMKLQEDEVDRAKWWKLSKLLHFEKQDFNKPEYFQAVERFLRMACPDLLADTIQTRGVAAV